MGLLACTISEGYVNKLLLQHLHWLWGQSYVDDGINDTSYARLLQESQFQEQQGKDKDVNNKPQTTQLETISIE